MIAVEQDEGAPQLQTLEELYKVLSLLRGRTLSLKLRRKRQDFSKWTGIYTPFLERLFLLDQLKAVRFREKQSIGADGEELEETSTRLVLRFEGTPRLKLKERHLKKLSVEVLQDGMVFALIHRGAKVGGGS